MLSFSLQCGMKLFLSHCSHNLYDVEWSTAPPQITNVRKSYAVAHCFHQFFHAQWSSPYCIAHIFSAVRNIAVFHVLLASSLQIKSCNSSNYLDPLSKSFGFLLPSLVWVGRFFTELIIWFFSPISRLSWEVFHQVNQVKVFTYISDITVNH